MKIILASKSPARKKLLLEMGLKFEIIPADIDEGKFQDLSPAVRVKKIAKAKAMEVLKRLVHGGYGGNERDEGKDAELLIIAADTLVYLPKDKIIGKPKDLKQAKEILTLLSGSTHWLYTGICVIYSPCHPEFISGSKQMLKQVQHDNYTKSMDKPSSTFGIDSRFRGNDKENGGNDKVKIFLDYDKTKVYFRKLSEEEINSYVKNPEVLNHAGTYTIEKSTPGEGFIKKIKGSYSNVLGLPVKKLRKILSNLGDLSNLET